MITKILEAFITTAQVGSFQKASNLLFISSPALIKQINSLEEETGLTLFARTNRGIELTEEGKAFYNLANEILLRYHEGISNCRQNDNASRKPLRIGFTATSPYQKLMDICFFDKEHFGKFLTTIQPIREEYKYFFDELQNLGSHVDVIPYFLGEKSLESTCNSFCLTRIPLKIAVSADHPFYTRDKLSYDDLNGCNLITLSSDTNKYYRQFNQTILANAPQTNLVYVRHYDFTQLNYAAAYNTLMLVGSYLNGVHPMLKLLDVDWDLTLPYGFYYSKNPSNVVSEWVHAFQSCGFSGREDDLEILYL